MNVSGDTRANNQHRVSIAPDTGDEGRFDSDAKNEKRKKMHNKTLLYTGLASVTTIAAANNIYQSTKASLARRQHLEQGEMCAAETKNMRNKAIMLDLFNVGVAAIGINSAINGWKTLERLRHEDKKASVKFQK